MDNVIDATLEDQEDQKQDLERVVEEYRLT